MDLPKFVSMLATGRLHFTCVSDFNDPYEGWLPRSYVEALAGVNRASIEKMRQTQDQMTAFYPSVDCAQLEKTLRDMEDKLVMSRLLKETNEKFGASCWHMNEGESEAMWRLYGLTGAGIAIESSRERLEAAMKDASPHTVHIEPVRYMDFDQDPIDKGGHRHLGFIKRKSFEHERELRALVMLPESGKGAGMPCDMNVLIAKVHIAPSAATYYADALRYVIEHTDPKLIVPIVVSKLLDSPDY